MFAGRALVFALVSAVEALNELPGVWVLVRSDAGSAHCIRMVHGFPHDVLAHVTQRQGVKLVALHWWKLDWGPIGSSNSSLGWFLRRLDDQRLLALCGHVLVLEGITLVLDIILILGCSRRATL